MLAPVIVVAGALAIIALERWLPYDRQRLWRDGLAVDLIGYALIQSAVLAIVIRGVVGAIDHGLGAVAGGAAMSSHGLVAGWPFAAQVAVFVVSHDFYIYWFHRWQHASPRLWRLHEAHHSARDIDWLAGSRSHALEIAINQTVEVAAMVLLGASTDVMLCKGAISIVSGMWIHANVDLGHPRLGALGAFGARWLGWVRCVVNGPALHRWHHAIDYAPPGKNFATKLALWDHAFGTADRPARKPAGYGLADPFPTGFLAQQAHAFRRR